MRGFWKVPAGGIGVAGVFSPDLINWKKQAPILDLGPEGSIDSRYAHKPGVIYHEGTLYHVYCPLAPEPDGAKWRGTSGAASASRGIALPNKRRGRPKLRTVTKGGKGA